MPPAPSPAILRLGIFFDGTGHHLANARPEDASNVAKLFALYSYAPERHQMRLYIEGIGTREDQANSLFAMATGIGSLGWKAAVDKAHDGVVKLLQSWISQYPAQPVDSLVIDLFGFSRGAVCARHFANDLCAGHDSALGRAIHRCKIESQALQRTALRIGFMGLFDTVASIMGPGNSPRLQLRDHLVGRIVHLVAADEHRHNYALSSAGAYDLPLPGAHGDIGGGYPPLMEERLILTRPDSSYIAPSQSPAAAPSFLRTKTLLAPTSTQQPDYGFDMHVRTWTKGQYSSSRGDRVEAVRVDAAIEGRRMVLNDLSHVYLQAMHRLAVTEGVPFEPLTPHEYPQELRPIIDKLLAYVCGHSPAHNLATHELAMLYRRYIHRSHHWTTATLGQTSDLDALFVHRPAAQGKRRILAP